MKKLYLGISLVIAFSMGLLSSNLINSKACLVQNIKLDKTLSIIDSKNCYITNVTFVTTDIAWVTK